MTVQKKTEAKRMGRPTLRTPEVCDEICERIVLGESLRSICRDERMPHIATVLRWCGDCKSFRDQYVRAREAQADTLVDEMLDIADDASNDWMERQGRDSAGYELNGEHVSRTRLRIDTRKWIAGKMRPKKYGDRVTQEVTGPDGGPLQISTARDKLAAALDVDD